MKKINKNIILRSIVIIVSLIFIFLSIYIKTNFGNINFELLLYSLMNATGTSYEAIIGGIVFVSCCLIISSFLILLIYCFLGKVKYLITFKILKKNCEIEICSFLRKYLALFLLIFSILFSFSYLGIFDYLSMQLNTSTLFENYYIDARDVEFNFPNKKKNLIYIIVESLEGTLMSMENGGAQRVSYLPNLELIAVDNISFSNNSKLGGLYTQTGNSWTAGALISHTSGVPLKISIGENDYAGYGEVLPGVYSIGQILEENGYNNYFLLGSDANFGGRKEYFEGHGNYKIMDYYWAIDYGKIPGDYYEWWGYEDRKLYKIAKQELTKIAAEDEPFNFTMLTADTHFLDGYIGKNCPNKFDTQYANAFYCTDMMINDFINWIKEQDFYKDTVIVIVGDHLSMQDDFFEDTKSYDRIIYNAFINTGIVEVNNKNRKASTMDLYPTTLAALGVKFSSDRLGLGTNLFSDKKTLLEELGSKTFNNELNKRSNFYNQELLKNTYYEMEKEVRIDENESK